MAAAGDDVLRKQAADAAQQAAGYGKVVAGQGLDSLNKYVQEGPAGISVLSVFRFTRSFCAERM